MVKKIEELDFYELLNLHVDATEQDIRNAYSLAVATYQPDALASYGVLSPEERRSVLERIEQAFETLGNAEARKAYDALIRPTRPEFQQRAFCRKSTRKLEIEDAGEKGNIWNRLRSLLFPGKSKKRKHEPGNGNEHKGWKALRKNRNLCGEHLKWAREGRGLTLEDVAQISGIDRGILRLLEENETASLPAGKETYDLVRRYASYLGINVENDE
jgi:curved DNA-binding protein CbpA